MVKHTTKCSLHTKQENNMHDALWKHLQYNQTPRSVDIEYSHKLSDMSKATWFSESIPYLGWQQHVDDLIDQGYIVKVNHNHIQGEK